MAVPTVTATAVTTAGSTASANPSVLLPATVNPLDLLVVLIRKDNEATMTFPAGWDKIVGDASDGSDDQTACAVKVADGTEDGSSITITTGVSGKYAALSYAIGGADSYAVSSLATGASTSPDPPNMAAPAGTQDYMYLWMGGWEGEQTSPPTGNPTNYTNPIGSNSGTAGATATNCRVASARRTIAANGADENAPSWAISVSDDWTAFLLALWKAPPPTQLPFLHKSRFWRWL